MVGSIPVRVYGTRRRRVRGRKLNKRQRHQVKRMIHSEQEIKYSIGNLDVNTITNAGFITGAPWNIAQGDTDQTRDGDTLKWIGKMHVRLGLVCADTTNVVRIIIFQWHPTSDNAPTPDVQDILAIGPSGSPDTLSHYNHDERQNFRVIFDKAYSLVGNGTADTYPGTTSTVIYRRYKISLRKARKRVQFTAGTTEGTNKFFFLAITDSAAGPNPEVAFSIKTFFTDS